MKKLPLLLALILCAQLAFAQSVHVFATYDDFLNGTPTDSLPFRLEQRDQGDIFMTGGIDNYKFGKVKPRSLKKRLYEEIWGVEQDGEVYISGYAYSRRKGFNKVKGSVPYRYFIGEPAILYENQVALGFIESGEEAMSVCCKTGYVLLEDGTVKLLTSERLLELVRTDADILQGVKDAKYQQEDIYKMFEALDVYNLKH